MIIERLDHLVLTTEHLEECLHFYVDILDMELVQKNGRYALRFGNQKINIHTRKAEFLPAAKNVEYGSLDLCLVVQGTAEEIRRELEEKGAVIEEGIVPRTGAVGPISSIYLRDPDGNLVELASYVSTEKQS